MDVVDQSVDMDNQVSTIKAMLQQEQSGYLVRDYLADLPECSSFGQPVDAAARSAIAGWCTKIMGVCDYNRETATVAMSYLDRFSASPEGYQILLDRKKYQLAALSCLYLAVKVHENNVLAPHLVARLSNGERSSEDIETMELQILQALKWRVHPPTAQSFVLNFLDIVSGTTLDSHTREVVLNLAQYQIDASLVHYEFCVTQASRIGAAALLNAAESASNDGDLLCRIEKLVSENTNTQNAEFAILRERLYEVISTTEIQVPSLPALRKPSCGFSAVTKPMESYKSSPRTVQLP